MENGTYSRGFLLWCRKLEHLTDDDFRRGFEQIEFLVKEAARQGDEIWPPSYAGFLGYCEKPHGTQAHKYFPRTGLPDKTAREREREIGRNEVKKLQSMFE
jgi:hypothetical protein